MKIQFCGAAGGVTGSKHIVQVAGKKILLDCGSFQGKRAITKELNSRLPFDASKIDAVILSHGHLDHCGSLPLLPKGGFKGRIYASQATIDVTKWMLLDAAHIHEFDAIYMKKHHKRGAEQAEPLFTTVDVEALMEYFTPLPYGKDQKTWTEIIPNIKVKLYDAGHILGSAMIVLEANEDGQIKRLAFSGDLGRKGTPLITDPEFFEEEIDALIIESTYGDRLHQPFSQAAEDLKQVINETVARNGKVIVPAFALGRTQELVYLLHELRDTNQIPRLNVYVDSPLATHLTEVFIKHKELYDSDTWKDFLSKGEAPLTFDYLKYISTADDSKALNLINEPFVVVSPSGSCEAGRVLHHLIQNIGDPRHTILITGFQASNTLGRRLIEGAKFVKIYGDDFPVKAQVKVINELSAHADSQGLQDLALNTNGLKNLFVVHGEPTQAEALKNKINLLKPELQITIPALYDSVEC